MITVSISGRKAVLLKTAELPTGNDSSIKVNFIFSDSDPVWKNARKIAVFRAVTPSGLKKRLPAVITKDDECYIPGKIISTPYSKVEVGVTAAYEDGSSASTNNVFLNSTGPGAGGDSLCGCEEEPVTKSDYQQFFEDLAASIDSEIIDLQSSIRKFEPILNCLAIDFNGNLQVNGESTLDYAQWFHLMSRQSETFCVKQYWDLLQYETFEEKPRPDTGEICKMMKVIDLKPDTLDGDSVFVKSACGTHIYQGDVDNIADFSLEINTVYPLIHFWQYHLPEPEENEEHVCAYAVLETLDGTTYSLSRQYSSKYETWVVELDISSLEGVYVYSWEDTPLLEKGCFVYLIDGEKVDWENRPKEWPIALDVKCVEVQYPEKLSKILFGHWPMNDHPPGRYVFDSNLDRWKREVDDMICCRVTVAKDSLGWDNRKTIIKRGCIPSDEVSLRTIKSNVKFSVVYQGYGYFTIEASEPLTEDVVVSLSINNTVERNDSYGLWSEW